MSDLSLKKLGEVDIEQYTEGIGENVSVDKVVGGWKFHQQVATSSTTPKKLILMGEEPITVRDISSIQVVISAENITYASLPELHIRTQPTGSGDHDPSYHDELRYKVRDLVFTKNNEYIFYYKKYEKENLNTENTKRYQLDLIQTIGTHDSSLNVKSVCLVAPENQLYNYTILEASHQNIGTNKIIERLTFSNLSIEDSIKTLTNRIQYESRKGHSQVMLGTTGATSMLADSTIVPKVDASLRDGMYFQNSTAGTKYNLYFFGGTTESIKPSEIKSIYAKMYIDDSEMPFFHIYTKPQGDGSDAQPWYNSKWTFNFNQNKILNGVESLLCAKSEPNNSMNVMHYLNDSFTLDGAGADVDVLFIALGSNSAATTDKLKHCINLLGFKGVKSTGEEFEKNFTLASKVGENYGRVSEELVSSLAVGSDVFFGPVIDLEGQKNLQLIGTGSAAGKINLYHSADGTSYYLASENTPITLDVSNHHYNIKVENCLRYYKMRTDTTANSFSIFKTVW